MAIDSNFRGNRVRQHDFAVYCWTRQIDIARCKDTSSLLPRIPNKLNRDDPDCDNELPTRALNYRKDKGLMTSADFRKYNITAWRLNVNGRPDFIVTKNVPISELRKKFGPAVDRKSEVGFHAEMQARDELSKRPEFAKHLIQVKAIFTERAPCPNDVPTNA
jgi:hypothetical protein